MSKYKLIQTQYNGPRTEVVETTTVDEFVTEASAIDYLMKRGYVFDNVYQAYIRGNTIQYPVTIVPSIDRTIFDIRSFAK
jgi:hypothetical protein